MNNFFSLKRILKLIRKDMLSEYKNLIIWLSTAAGVMLVISALTMFMAKMQGGYTGNTHFHFVFYVILLFPGGYILTSSMFKDIHDKSKNIYWLMLPGSTFEKMLSRLIISSLFFSIGLTLIYPLLALASEMFNLLLFGIRHEFFNPFSTDVLRLIPYYLVSQSIFFAGAASFRKHPFAKTLLSLALFQICFSIIAAVLLRLFMGSYFNDVQNIQFNEWDLMKYTGNSMDSVTGFGRFMITALRIFFWGLLAPFFYFLSYFKLSEKEVRDGI